jgi:catalase
MTITPADAIDGINERFGRHPGYRALHAKGLLCKGSFTATPEAADLTRAAHMQGETVPVIARFSNAGGDPTVPDYVPDVRGFAVSFQLPDGSSADIVAQTAKSFPVHTPDAFMELVKANAAGPSRIWKFPLFLVKHPEALPSLRNLPLLKPPLSFATLAYYAIHAFKWVDSEGNECHVRYTLVPEAGEERISVGQAKKGGADYLQEEIANRLAREPVRFKLQLQIAEDGDEVDDPVATWPEDRRTVVAGTVELTSLTPEEGLLVFDPVKVTDGIELSNDPILRYRTLAYSESAERRAHTP